MKIVAIVLLLAFSFALMMYAAKEPAIAVAQAPEWQPEPPAEQPAAPKKEYTPEDFERAAADFAKLIEEANKKVIDAIKEIPAPVAAAAPDDGAVLDAIKALDVKLDVILENTKQPDLSQGARPREQTLLTGIQCPDCGGDGVRDNGKACSTCAGDGVLSEGEKKWSDQQEAARKAREELKIAIEAEEAAKKKAVIVPWFYNIREATLKAKELHRPLFVAYATTGCQLCDEVKAHVYPKVANKLCTEYVPCWIYVTEANGKQFDADKFDVTKYPTCVVSLVGDGEAPYLKFVPEDDADKFVLTLDAALARVSESK